MILMAGVKMKFFKEELNIIQLIKITIMVLAGTIAMREIFEIKLLLKEILEKL